MILGAAFPEGLWGSAGEMVILAMRSGQGVSRRHLAASSYFLPLERSLAASQDIWNQGWFSRSWMKRWPTMPVAPRMPISCLFCIVVDPPVYRRGEANRANSRQIADQKRGTELGVRLQIGRGSDKDDKYTAGVCRFKKSAHAPIMLPEDPIGRRRYLCVPGTIRQFGPTRQAAALLRGVRWGCCWRGGRSTSCSPMLWRIPGCGARFCGIRSGWRSRNRRQICCRRCRRSYASSMPTGLIRRRRSRRAGRSGGTLSQCSLADAA